MWTAITLATLIAAGVAAYVAWAAYAIARGAALWPFVLGLPLTYLAVPFFFTCAWVTMGWWMRAPRPEDVVLGWRQRVRLFGGEFADRAIVVGTPGVSPQREFGVQPLIQPTEGKMFTGG